MATKQLPASGQEFDPKYEWQENANSFILRLHLSGFRKEDFRVQVDGAGRLTVRGQRAADGGKHVRFHNVFQLPATSNLDDISGRFDAGVLTLTVPKRPATAPPATVEAINKPAKEAGDDAKPKAVDAGAKPKEETKKPSLDEGKPKDEAKKAEQHKEEMKKPKDDAKPKEDAKKKPDEQQVKEEVEAKQRSKPEQDRQKAAPPAVRKEEEKPKAGEAAAAAPATEKKQAKPPQAEGERATTQAVDRESLVEKVRRLVEEDRAKAVAAAAAEAERERKTTACGGWKERVAEGLEGLPVTEWAEGLAETVKKNKEMIAAAVAAFSLGLFVSSRLFSRN